MKANQARRNSKVYCRFYRVGLTKKNSRGIFATYNC